MAKGGKGPDPGSYDVTGKSIVTAAQPVYSIGKGLRSGPVKGMHVPGPGQYESEYKAYGSQISIGKKLGSCLDGEKGGAPGPGNYNTQNVTKNVQGGKFGVKFVTSANRMDSNLGPG